MLSDMGFFIWFTMYLSCQIIENVVFSCLMKLNILQIITSLAQVSKNAPNQRRWLAGGSFDLVAEMVASRRRLVEGGQQPMAWWMVGTANNPWTAPFVLNFLL
jgi:hypothetical protein